MALKLIILLLTFKYSYRYIINNDFFELFSLKIKYTYMKNLIIINTIFY